MTPIERRDQARAISNSPVLQQQDPVPASSSSSLHLSEAVNASCMEEESAALPMYFSCVIPVPICESSQSLEIELVETDSKAASIWSINSEISGHSFVLPEWDRVLHVGDVILSVNSNPTSKLQHVLREIEYAVGPLARSTTVNIGIERIINSEIIVPNVFTKKEIYSV